MKKQILTIATLACITFVGVSAAVANSQQHHDPMRNFVKLKLSDQQKQDMRAIFKATRENNGVYAGEKKEIMIQMQELMNMPSWDQASAETIIKSQVQQRQHIALNRAKARNQVYNLLTDEQKATLAEKEAEKTAGRAKYQHANDGEGKKSKSKRKGKAGKMKLARLSKALHLTNEQVTQFKAIDANAKQQMLVLKEQGKAHHESMKAIVHTSSFDETAWLSAHSSAIDEMVAFKLIKTKARYDQVSLLTDEQKEKFTKIMKKMKDKHGKAGSM